MAWYPEIIAMLVVVTSVAGLVCDLRSGTVKCFWKYQNLCVQELFSAIYPELLNKLCDLWGTENI